MAKEDNWIQTASGKKFHIFAPKEEEIDINDIAHSLSLMCRFNGHCLFFYSVAEHSVRICDYLKIIGQDRHVQLFGLMHDSQESFIGDSSRPLKMFMDNFKELEKKIFQVIMKKYHLDTIHNLEGCKKIVKEADDRFLATEARDIMVPHPDKWLLPQPPIDQKIIPYSSIEAERMFLDRFYKLYNNGKTAFGTAYI